MVENHWRFKSNIIGSSTNVQDQFRCKYFIRDLSVVCSDLGCILIVYLTQDRVYELLDEAEMMENLGIVLPREIHMLLAKKNSLLGDIMKVKHMVNAYNSFVSSLNNLEVSRCV